MHVCFCCEAPSSGWTQLSPGRMEEPGEKLSPPLLFKFQTNYITLGTKPNGLNSRRTVGASGPSKDERVVFVADWPGKERTLKIAIQNDGWLSKEEEQTEIDFAISRNLIAAFNRQRWESSTSLSSVASSSSSSCDAEWVPLASCRNVWGLFEPKYVLLILLKTWLILVC